MSEATRKALQAYALSAAFTVQSALTVAIGIGYGLGLCSTFPATISFLANNWWQIFIGLILGIGPYYRAHSGYTNLPPSNKQAP